MIKNFKSLYALLLAISVIGCAVAAPQIKVETSAKVDSKELATAIQEVKSKNLSVLNVAIVPTSASINVQEPINFQAVAKLSDGTTNSNVIWHSSNPSVATVENGNLKTLKEGNVIITVSSSIDPTISASASIKVNPSNTQEEKKEPPPKIVSNVEVKPMDKPVAVGEKIKPDAVVNFSDKEQSKEVEWVSEDENIAKIDKDGNVVAVGEGKVKITAKAKSLEDTATGSIVLNIIITTTPKIDTSTDKAGNVAVSVGINESTQVAGTVDIDKASIKIGETLKIRVTDIQGEVVKYKFDFGDETSPVETTQPYIEHTYMIQGRFEVSVQLFGENNTTFNSSTSNNSAFITVKSEEGEN